VYHSIISKILTTFCILIFISIEEEVAPDEDDEEDEEDDSDDDGECMFIAL